MVQGGNVLYLFAMNQRVWVAVKIITEILKCTDWSLLYRGDLRPKQIPVGMFGIEC